MQWDHIELPVTFEHRSVLKELQKALEEQLFFFVPMPHGHRLYVRTRCGDPFRRDMSVWVRIDIDTMPAFEHF